jgi:ABC transporter transmembrane region
MFCCCRRVRKNVPAMFPYYHHPSFAPPAIIIRNYRIVQLRQQRTLSWSSCTTSIMYRHHVHSSSLSDVLQLKYRSLWNNNCAVTTKKSNAHHWRVRYHHQDSHRRLSTTTTTTTSNSSRPPPPPPPQSNYWRMVLSLGQHLWPTTSTVTTTTTTTRSDPTDAVVVPTTGKKQLITATTHEQNVQLKQRVVLSLGLMMAAKAITIQVPFVFKHLVDSLPPATTNTMMMMEESIHTTTTAAAASSSNLIDTAVMLDPSVAASTGAIIPISLLLGYGISRATAVTLQELRNTIFHVVVQDAIRNIGCQVLNHTLRLDLQFHLSRNTGQLSRTMEHGLRSIGTVLNSMVFHIVPTVLEVALVTGIMSYQFGSAHASVVLATVISYTAFTFAVTSWRTKFRREMNRLATEASGRTVDSFLNFETVQNFNNVQHEGDRYEKTMKAFSASSLEAQQSLSFLNIGQSAIFSVGLTAVMWLTYDQILTGQATVGDLVLANGLLFQVSVRTYINS